jgi:hypothetical protein
MSNRKSSTGVLLLLEKENHMEYLDWLFEKWFWRISSRMLGLRRWDLFTR